MDVRCFQRYEEDSLLATEIDPFDVLDSLGVTGCSDAIQAHGGWDTNIWRVTRGPETYALRLFREGDNQAAGQEARTMRAVRAAGLQVPSIQVEGTWRGQAAFVIDWCDGRTLMQEMRVRPWTIRSLGYEFGKRQAEMHGTVFDAPHAGESDWVTFFGPVDDELYGRLMAIERTSGRILHLDYHPLNVMVSKRSIGCILDWSNAMPGDPRADVARTWSILRLMPLNPGRPEPVTEAARRLLAAGWLRGYQDTAGILEHMDIFKAWAGQAMVHDLQSKVELPDNWIDQSHVNAIQRRSDQLRSQAGLS